MEIKNSTEYNSNILSGLTAEQKKDRLDKILDIRKFEIELYWKRATYFWSFIAAAFTAYGATYDKVELLRFQFLSICIGLVFSVAFYLVNRASKFWQENWEQHTDYMEDSIIGKLYKITLPQSECEDFFKPLERYSTSVSKINILLSLFIVVIWTILYINFIWTRFSFQCHDISIYYSILCTITPLCIYLLLFGTKSNLKKATKSKVIMVER